MIYCAMVQDEKIYNYTAVYNHTKTNLDNLPT
jgi:hypothetical protein